MIVPLSIIIFCFCCTTLEAQSDKKVYKIKGDQFSTYAPAAKKIIPLDLMLLERAVHFYTNLERKKKGLKPLHYSPRLLKASRQHSLEMNDLKYFSHDSPVAEYARLGNRLEKVGLHNVWSAENISVQFTKAIKNGRSFFKKKSTEGHEVLVDVLTNKTIDYYTYHTFAKEIVKRWMESLGHRENILGNKYKYLACGAVLGRFNGREAIFFTQVFTSND